MISFLIYPPEQTKTYPSKQESRKIIIDSKVPVGMGYVTSREGRSPDHSTKPDTLSSATTSIRIIVRLTANLWISMGSWRRGVGLYFLRGVLFNTKGRKLRSKHTKYISILNMFKTKCNSFVYNIYIQYIYNIYIYCIRISTKMIFSKLSPLILFWNFIQVCLYFHSSELWRNQIQIACVFLNFILLWLKMRVPVCSQKTVGTIFYYWTIKFCSAKYGQLVRPFLNGGILLSSSQKKPFQLWPCF